MRNTSLIEKNASPQKKREMKRNHNENTEFRRCDDEIKHAKWYQKSQKSLIEFQVGDFIVAYIIFDFGTKKEAKKFYIGKILKIGVGRSKGQIKVDFLRKIPTKEKMSENEMIGFSYPRIRDCWNIDPDQIYENLRSPVVENRGRLFFKNDKKLVLC